MATYPPPQMPQHHHHHQQLFSKPAVTSLPRPKVPYGLTTPVHPPTPSSSFDPSSNGMQFASPGGYSQPPTPSSMLDPHQVVPQQSNGSSPGFASDPMDRFMQSETPFSTVHLSAQSMPHGTTYPPPPSFAAMQPSVRSDSVSLNTPLRAVAHSDAGYVSMHQRAYSNGSHDPSSFNQDLPEVISPLDSLKVSPRASSAARPRTSRQSRSQGSLPAIHHDSSSFNGREENVCPHCDHRPRLKSELKKHVLRHERPFTCEFNDCNRFRLGFTTPNDLDRHRRSKHKIFPDTAKVYVCASPSCAEQGKAWPRFDNFKQHVDRMHKMEDQDSLLQRSIQLASEVGAGKIMAATDASMHDLKGIEGSRDGLAANADNYPSFEEMPMFNEETLHPSQVSQSDGHPMTESMNGFEHGYESASVGAPGYYEGTANHFDEQQWSAPLDPNYGYDSVAQGPAIVVHNAQGQKQRQDHEMAHMSTGDGQQQQQQSHDIVSPPMFKGTSLEQEFKLPTTQSTHLASRKRQPLMSRAANRPPKVYKANSTGSRAVTVVNGGSRVPPSKIQRSGVQPSHTSKPASTSTSTGGAQCPQCKKVLARPCDLKKHARRHTRPFGCTFDACGKQFGSKNDWKRHESSQHFQQLQWRCDACARLFAAQPAFDAHFAAAHPAHVLDGPRRARCRIGNNHQTSFWCGFCTAVLPLESEGRKAWDERFDHIADHFLHEGRRIADWLSPQGNSTKGQMAAVGEPARPGIKGGNGKAAAEEAPLSKATAMDGVDGAAESDADSTDSAADGGGDEHAQCFCCSCADGPYAAATVSCACQACGHTCADCFGRARVLQMDGGSIAA